MPITKRKPWPIKISKAAASAPTAATYFGATVTPSDVARRYGRRTKPAELVKRYMACPTVAYCVDLNASVLAHFTPRIYKRGDAKSPFAGVKQRRVTSLRVLKCLADTRRNGKAAVYAEDAREDVFEVTAHPFIDLYRRPNPIETRMGFWGAEWALRQIAGNAYSLVVRDGNFPKELWHCYPQHINPQLSRDRFIDGYQYWVAGGDPVIFDADDILHTIWTQSPLQPHDGRGWVEGCVRDIDALISMDSVEQARYENNCMFEGVFLLPDDATEIQAQQFEASVNAKHKGVYNAGKFLVTRGATDFKPVSWSNRDMQYLASVELHERRIRNNAGVPEAFANLNQSNLASALQADGLYSSGTIQPQLVNHAEMMTAFLLREYGLAEGEYWIAYDNILETNADEVAALAEKKYQSGGLTLNEYRAEIGQDPVADERGDLFIYEFQSHATSKYGPSISQGFGGGGEGESTVLQDGASLHLMPAAPRPYPAPDKPAPAAEEAKAAPTPAPKPRKSARAKAAEQPGVPPEDRQDLLDAVQEWLAESVTARSYNAPALQAMISEPLGSIFQVGGIHGIEKLAASGIDVAGLPGAALNAANVSFDVIPEQALKFLETYTVRLSEAISAAQGAELNSALSAALAQGENAREARDRVLEVMKDRTFDDATRIANTETSRAYNQGSLTAWTGLGVEQKQWQLAPGPCPICEALVRKVPGPIPLDQPFMALGDSVDVGGGKTFAFTYEAILAPPAHCNCRCALRPIHTGDTQ